MVLATVVVGSAGLAIGVVVASLLTVVQPRIANNITCSYESTNYYQPCAQGADMNYCVVSDPNQ